MSIYQTIYDNLVVSRKHLKTLCETGEIDPNPTIRKFRIVRQEELIKTLILLLDFCRGGDHFIGSVKIGQILELLLFL